MSLINGLKILLDGEKIMLTKEQVLERRNYLGGSDCAGVLGLSRWNTPLQIWAEKTGAVEPTDISQKLAIKMGDRLEDIVADLFTEATGKKVVRKNDTIFHKEYPFLGANIDRRIVGEDALLECKTTSAWKAKEWDGEEIPIEYIMQCNHYLAVTGMKTAYIAVLIGGNQDFVWKRIDRDENIINQITAKEASFWFNFVVPKIQPDTITYKDKDILMKLYPNTKNEEPAIQLTDEVNRIVESIIAMEQDSKQLANQIEAERNRLKALLKENANGETSLYKVSWREQIREGIDSKKLRLEMPDVASKYIKETKVRVLKFGSKGE